MEKYRDLIASIVNSKPTEEIPKFISSDLKELQKQIEILRKTNYRLQQEKGDL